MSPARAKTAAKPVGTKRTVILWPQNVPKQDGGSADEETKSGEGEADQERGDVVNDEQQSDEAQEEPDAGNVVSADSTMGVASTQEAPRVVTESDWGAITATIQQLAGQIENLYGTSAEEARADPPVGTNGVSLTTMLQQLTTMLQQLATMLPQAQTAASGDDQRRVTDKSNSDAVTASDEGALLRRYGEKLDKSAAEWRVNMRMLMPGETHADFAAGLRDVVGRNHVRERVLLAQFYRCLDKTTKKLVKQPPKPKTLEQAVAKATKIDDPMDNLTQGMINIGQAWATAPTRYIISMSGTMWNTNVIPGISGTGLPTELMGGTSGESTVRSEAEQVALFSNPQGVYNSYSGTWDPPPGRVWNGKFWCEPRKTRKATAATGRYAETKRPDSRAKQRKETVTSSSEEPDDKPRWKRAKAAVRQVNTGASRTVGYSSDDRRPATTVVVSEQLEGDGVRATEPPQHDASHRGTGLMVTVTELSAGGNWTNEENETKEEHPDGGAQSEVVYGME
ncbi:unnamed protein product [Phytophthora fragariaefolia]|uniref:Unnamed protein product n=1 Tax=Phytophthora fragariaefolia TaxID=1490495 RepID=A0A9W6YMG7_9STRA|nr:unnamed protein product [Phytophthora fragariaefolia]